MGPEKLRASRFSGLAGFPSIRDCEAVGRRIGGWLAGGAFGQRPGAALVADGGAVVFSRPAELSGEKLRALKHCGRRGFSGLAGFPFTRDCTAIGGLIGGWLAGGPFGQRAGRALVAEGGGVVFSRPALA